MLRWLSNRETGLKLGFVLLAYRIASQIVDSPLARIASWNFLISIWMWSSALNPKSVVADTEDSSLGHAAYCYCYFIVGKMHSWFLIMPVLRAVVPIWNLRLVRTWNPVRLSDRQTYRLPLHWREAKVWAFTAGKSSRSIKKYNRVRVCGIPKSFDLMPDPKQGHTQ